MNPPKELKVYSPLEEKANILSHTLGLLLSFAALILLVVRAGRYGDAWHVVGAAIFGASLIALYAASTAYHSATNPARRARLRIIDHATIYILIAGTYTPFSLVTLHGPVGWTIFGVTWGMAAIGTVLKLFFTGRFNLVSTLMYVFMGWIIVFAVKPLIANFPLEGIYWLVAGGVSYTTGAVIYSIGKMPLNHAIFHVFVLGGSICHFVAVYFYLLPGP